LPYSAQVCRKNVLQLHCPDDHASGTILLGTIVPIRYYVPVFKTTASKLGRVALESVPPAGGATDYDRLHLMTYAELLDADRDGVAWEQGASAILGLDPAADPEGARLCWDSHLARARWIVGEGLASAVEAFGRNPHA
jgi:hypothetical protein